jgi:hypothetical protein
MKHKHVICGRNVGFRCVKAGGMSTCINTGLLRVKLNCREHVLKVKKHHLTALFLSEALDIGLFHVYFKNKVDYFSLPPCSYHIETCSMALLMNLLILPVRAIKTLIIRYKLLFVFRLIKCFEM